MALDFNGVQSFKVFPRHLREEPAASLMQVTVNLHAELYVLVHIDSYVFADPESYRYRVGEKRDRCLALDGHLLLLAGPGEAFSFLSSRRVLSLMSDS